MVGEVPRGRHLLQVEKRCHKHVLEDDPTLRVYENSLASVSNIPAQWIHQGDVETHR